MCVNVYVHILHANEYKGTEAEKPVLPDTKRRGCSWRWHPCDPPGLSSVVARLSFGSKGNAIGWYKGVCLSLNIGNDMSGQVSKSAENLSIKTFHTRCNWNPGRRLCCTTATSCIFRDWRRIVLEGRREDPSSFHCNLGVDYHRHYTNISIITTYDIVVHNKDPTQCSPHGGLLLVVHDMWAGT